MAGLNLGGPGADTRPVGVLDDVIVAVMAGSTAGRRRGRRPPRRYEPVTPTPWLAVGVAAVVAQAVILAAASAALGWFAWNFGSDELLFVLGIILFPIALSGVTAGLSGVVWMARVVRRLLEGDGTARLELAVLGIGGTFVGAWLLMMGLALPGVVVLVPSLAAGAVAAVPDAWRPLS